jgi:hypothetical protein
MCVTPGTKSTQNLSPKLTFAEVKSFRGSLLFRGGSRAAVRASPRVRLACLRLAARVRCVLACSSAACLHAAHRVLAALLARGLTLAFALSTLLSLHAIILCTLADALALAFALALACSHAPPPSPSSSHAPSPSPSPSPSAQHAAHRVLAALLAPVH